MQLPKGSVPPWDRFPPILSTPWPRLPLSVHRINAERAGYYAYRNPEGIQLLVKTFMSRIFLTPPVTILPKVPSSTVRSFQEMMPQDIALMLPHNITPDNRWITNFDLKLLWDPTLEYTVRTTPVYVNVPIGLLNFLNDKEWRLLRQAGHIIPAFSPDMPLSCPFRFPLTPCTAFEAFNYMRTGALILAERDDYVPMLISRQLAAAMGMEFTAQMDLISIAEFLSYNVPEYDPEKWEAVIKDQLPLASTVALTMPSTEAIATLATMPLFPGFADGGFNHNTYVAPWQVSGNVLEKDSNWNPHTMEGTLYQGETPVAPARAIVQARMAPYVKESELGHPDRMLDEPREPVLEAWWTNVAVDAGQGKPDGYRRDKRGVRL